MIKKLIVNKKIIAIILLFLTMFSIISPTVVTAISGSGRFVAGQFQSNVKTTDHTGDEAGILIRKLVNVTTGDQYTVFCAEHRVDFFTNVIYDGTYYTPTNDEMKRMCKIAYFGWYSKHPSYVINGGILGEDKYDTKLDYVFTQQYIWESLGQSNATFIESDIQSKYVDFKAEINQKIANMQKTPLFDAIEIEIGESKTITDKNKVLKDYPSLDKTTNGIRIQHNEGENTLTITASEDCTVERLNISNDTFSSWGMIKEASKDNDTTIYFEFENGVQDQLYALHYNDPVTMSLSLKLEALGKLELRKLNTDGDLINGAVFTVTGPDGYNKDVTITNGKIVLEKLKKGKYYVREKTAPKGFLLDTQTYQVEVETNKTAVQAIVNDEPTGNFTLTKYNSDKSKKIAGVKYRIWNDSGYDKEFTTDSKGEIKATGLKLGKYYYQEQKSVNGYLRDDTTYSFTLKYKDQNTSVVYASEDRTNDEPTGNFTLTKYNSDKSKRLEGVKYRIWNDSGYDKEFTTDSKGEIKVTGLKLGKYYYQEQKSIYGYLRDNKTYSFTLTYKDENTSVVYASADATNDEPTGTFTLTKYNSDKSAKIAGVKYRIWNDSGYDKEFTTDSKGEIKVTGLKLGKYYYQEIQSVNGYLIDNKAYSFTLTYKDENTSVIYASADQTNDEPTGEIEIEKIDKDTGNQNRIDGTSHHGDASIKGAVYTLYASSDIYNVAGTVKYFSKDEQIATFTFNEYGVASVKITNTTTPAQLSVNGTTLKGLPMGSFYSRETTAPTGYTTDTSTYTYTLSYKDSNTPVIKTSGIVKNKVEQAPFEVIKVTTNSNTIAEMVEGAEFTAILSKYVDFYGSFDEAKKHLNEFAKDEYSIFKTGSNGHRSF